MIRRPTALLLCVACAAAASATRPIEDVSSAVAAVHAKHRVPALAGAIVDLHGPVGVGVSGLRRVGTTRPALPGDAFHLGSCTKSMTALLVGRLIDAKRIAFDSTMADCFPELAPRMHATLRDATVRQLIEHRAGLPANLQWGLIALGGGTPEAQRRRVAEMALCARPAVPPGEFLYSNVGYTLLGAIVDARAGVTWEDVIRRDLFGRLGMTTAGLGPPPVDGVWGHNDIDGEWTPWRLDNPQVMNPAGRVHCSMADWSRYVAACLRASAGDTDLISAATYRALTTPAAGGAYAGGWGVTQRDWAGGRTLTHSGSNGSWYCVAWLAPDRGFAVLAATNAATPDAARACDDLAAAMLDARGAPPATTRPAPR